MVFNLLVPSGAIGQTESITRPLAYYGAVNPLRNLRIIDLDVQYNESAAKHALSTRTHASPDDPVMLPKFFRSFEDVATAHCFSGAGDVIYLLEAGRRLRKEPPSSRYYYTWQYRELSGLCRHSYTLYDLYLQEARTDESHGRCDTYIVTLPFPQGANYVELLQHGLSIDSPVKVYFQPPTATGKDTLYISGTVLTISLPSVGGSPLQRILRLRVRRPQADNGHPSAELAVVAVIYTLSPSCSPRE